MPKNQENIDNLKKGIDAALEFQDQDLIKRGGWGAITFESAEDDLERIFSVLSHLKLLPLDDLTDKAVSQIIKSLQEVVKALNAIDGFTIEQANPTQVRDQLAAQLGQSSDSFYEAATPWIPFLAYQKGDVAKNIEDLTQSVSNAATLISNAKTDIETKKSEIDGIITQAREASAAAGAAVFTKDFDAESKDQKKAAFRWLLATGGLGFLTILAAIATWWIGLSVEFDGFNAIQAFGGKIAILVVFFTATLWCGRVYRALMHQATLNRHRALGLQTFQAFSAAASDDASKDAVLLETTRSIFSTGNTGYLDTQDQGSTQEIRLSEGSRHPIVIKTVEQVSRSSDG